jgi:hypothetical protein
VLREGFMIQFIIPLLTMVGCSVLDDEESQDTSTKNQRTINDCYTVSEYLSARQASLSDHIIREAPSGFIARYNY